VAQSSMACARRHCSETRPHEHKGAKQASRVTLRYSRVYHDTVYMIYTFGVEALEIPKICLWPPPRAPSIVICEMTRIEFAWHRLSTLSIHVRGVTRQRRRTCRIPIICTKHPSMRLSIYTVIRWQYNSLRPGLPISGHINSEKCTQY
jgi:hypothetical protein